MRYKIPSSCTAVLVGLIAQLTGCALQDDIAGMVRRLQQLGRDILDQSPNSQEVISMHQHLSALMIRGK